jgi:dipeptidyl-peptidase-3
LNIADKKKPRKVFVQAQTIVQDGKAELVEFEASPQGMIDSNLARFQ